MIIIMTGAYAGLLLLLIKFGIFKQWVGWMSASCVFVFVFMLLVFVIPMNFGAPSGPMVVMKRSVQIRPNVAGPVIDVTVSQNTPVLKNDVLFQIDPAPFQAAVDSLSARLALAELRLEQTSTLAAGQAGSQFEVQQYIAEVSGLKADLKGAQWNLDQTSVRAPNDGWVPFTAVRPGVRVTPGQTVMSFIDESSAFLAVQIAQINTRHIQAGDEAEVIFKVYPGQIFAATVVNVIKANSSGQLTLGATSIDDFEGSPFLVRLQLSDPEVTLPAGAVGTAAIYTDQFQGLSHVFRKIFLHQQNWKNYVQI
jgi:RND family efflux transporter MFP subunit